ncbi:helix-turn-helix domain-containing protein [Streptomyces viridochromogenes]|uniref:helix-turn-helix domain-containing protein n=1 Tax=Streptomyces viridochromogenes TaxID=1938 RepID=UPI00131DBA8B|nr:helix-turn-helix domain-containing protein [Streptomyces viridochromogenes]
MLNEMLLNLRQRNGWTQEELSELSGVSVRTIRNLETGKVSHPRRASLRLLSSVLDPEGRQAFLMKQLTHAGLAAPWNGTKSPQNALVGRDEDLRFLSGVIRERRLVVLVGPGGVGKTRLAMALAESATDGPVNGVSVIDLGSLPAEGDEPRQSYERVSAAVTKERLHPSHLVVLDNAEHLAPSVTRLSRRLLSDHPGLRLIITSRLRLAMDAACTWEVTPLRTDSSCARGGLPPAVELVLQRTRTSYPGLADTMDPAQVQRLCQLLDGIPRYLEIAAERLRSVSLEDLLALLENDAKLEVLRSVDGSLLPHQRDIVRSVEWSLALLDPALRSFLSRLASISGEFSLQDIERFPSSASSAPPAPFPPLDIVQMLAQLADHSLVQVVRGDVYRYRVLSCVRSVVLSAAEHAIPVDA